MPLPIAHPAAVLPFRTLCPKWFNFSALAIGSLIPDFGYCFPTLRLGIFSHTLKGSFAFCLPAGVVSLAILWSLAPRIPWVRRCCLSSFRFEPSPTFLIVTVLSLLCGSWTHLLFDSMTHRYGTIVRHVPALRIPLGVFAHHSVRVHHVLWYFLSFAGVAWLSLAFQTWQGHAEQRLSRPLIPRVVTAVTFGVVAILIGMLHHAIPGTIGDIAGAFCSLGLVAVALKVG